MKAHELDLGLDHGLSNKLDYGLKKDEHADQGLKQNLSLSNILKNEKPTKIDKEESRGCSLDGSCG